jgi:NADH-quinone oxidoreductase subunit K
MTEIGLGHYLTLGAVIFSIGIIGIFLNRKNIIVILMSIELILLAVNINLVAFSIFLGDLAGQVFTLFILTVAAAGSCYWISNHSCLLPKLWNYTS